MNPDSASFEGGAQRSTGAESLCLYAGFSSGAGLLEVGPAVGKEAVKPLQSMGRLCAWKLLKRAKASTPFPHKGNPSLKPQPKKDKRHSPDSVVRPPEH
jgi:hypothetical protein